MTDPIATLATWIAGHVEWMRHRQEADEFLTAVDACTRVVRGIARGPSEQRFLGPCGAILEAIGTDDGRLVTITCDGDVYAYRGAKTGRCRTCGAEVATAERQAWLDELVRDRAFYDTEIADATGINIKTIREWATDRPASRNSAGKLTRSASPAKLQAHTHDRDGKPLYLMGAVVDIAAEVALRRHERHQRRTSVDKIADGSHDLRIQESR
jgi:hypothetical protein